MATFLDITLLEGFRGIFVFLLVWIVVYGVLALTQPFGKEKTGLYAFIGLILGLLTLFSNSVLAIITIIAPWFAGLAMFVFFMIIVFLTLGYTPGDIQSTIKGDNWNTTIVTWIIVLSVIILLGGAGVVFFSGTAPETGTQGLGGQFTGANTDDPGTVSGVGPDAFFATFFHPRVLGMIVVLLMGFLAILFLAKGGTVSGGGK